MWMTPKSYRNGVFYGVLANEPEVLKRSKIGDTVEVKREVVEDWMVLDSTLNSVEGGYSVRAVDERASRYNPNP